MNREIDYIKNPESKIISDADSIIDDTLINNILVGTSYSEESLGNNLRFANFLRMFSHSDVLNCSKGGGGLSSAMRDFIESPQFVDSQPHTLVWEFPLTLIRDSSDKLNQIIAAIKFHTCKANEIRRLSSIGPVFAFPQIHSIVRINFLIRQPQI
ncbi:hypothetical protein DKM44_06810 [Deinococcus irradiatisoli]|uniref:AlgX/AlgJ SGNH hydrolase-like domain-containing protein n=1 Tax=Deinococcus irradiatisoli TaxID=2202254 RepID=A0A2Z3JPB2_9DEIO|nr:hypothetical protein DKM44_06810 [Deinococcus irradiatisoli]